ncbi:MAG: type II secretion system F family protein [Tessaracoccus sp.]|uniref:type II secretion system F family protein n=1 Tax=Tessaracoccus sp. TaxID=1971211 RepID=UPI001ECE77A6|nr:type II secretion system F family protein [Tessaracoccus sp.]MBK7822056.1 type II secretion system F family protein [Tessaracoccus sp.]
MTGLQLAMLSGALLLAGVAGLIGWAIPANVHLKDAIGRLQPLPTIAPPAAGGRRDTETTIGAWAQRHLPAALWGTSPDKDLALLGRTTASLYGSKIISAAIGLTIIPITSLILTLLGWSVPLGIPAIGSVALAAVMWFLPSNELRDKARKAREEFSYALGAFVEMVALERLSGATVPQALLHAADTGDSWVFDRIAAVLRRTQYTGQSPWDALADMGTALDLPDLVDLADIMRLGGSDGTRVYDSLRARAATMRNVTLNNQISRANQASERIAVPVALLVFVLALTLITPALLRML